MNFEQEHRERAAIFHLLSPLDFVHAPGFEKQIETQTEIYALRIILNFARCDYVDSSGFSMLVKLHRRCETKGGAVLIAAPPRHALLALKMSRLDRLFPVFDTVEEALQTEL